MKLKTRAKHSHYHDRVDGKGLIPGLIYPAIIPGLIYKYVSPG